MLLSGGLQRAAASKQSTGCNTEERFKPCLKRQQASVAVLLFARLMSSTKPGDELLAADGAKSFAGRGKESLRVNDLGALVGEDLVISHRHI